MSINPYLDELIARRKRLQAAYDELITQPASYSLSGSVSVTNAKLAELRKEIASIDAQINEIMLGPAGPGGSRRYYPRYRQ